MSSAQWYTEINSGGLVVGRFRYDESLPDVAASKAADSVIMRKIIVLESKAVASSDVSVQIVKPHNERELRMRFPEAWKAFMGEEVAIEGTPIKDMGIFNEDQILFLQINGVRSVEQLANLDDAKCGNLGFGWRTHREKAKKFLGGMIEGAKREGARIQFAESEQASARALVQDTMVEKSPEAAPGPTMADLQAQIAALTAKLAEQPAQPDRMAKARAAKAARRGPEAAAEASEAA